MALSMRRIFSVIAVAALMAAMMAAMAMPAFADKGGGKEHNWGNHGDGDNGFHGDGDGGTHGDYNWGTHGEYDRGVGNGVCDHPKIGCD